jgi:hypothetical protein
LKSACSNFVIGAPYWPAGSTIQPPRGRVASESFKNHSRSIALASKTRELRVLFAKKLRR